MRRAIFVGLLTFWLLGCATIRSPREHEPSNSYCPEEYEAFTFGSRDYGAGTILGKRMIKKSIEGLQLIQNLLELSANFKEAIRVEAKVVETKVDESPYLGHGHIDIYINGLDFIENEGNLSPKSQVLLNALVDLLSGYPEYNLKVVVFGMTREQANKRLSVFQSYVAQTGIRLLWQVWKTNVDFVSGESERSAPNAIVTILNAYTGSYLVPQYGLPVLQINIEDFSEFSRSNPNDFISEAIKKSNVNSGGFNLIRGLKSMGPDGEIWQVDIFGGVWTGVDCKVTNGEEWGAFSYRARR